MDLPSVWQSSYRKENTTMAGEEEVNVVSFAERSRAGQIETNRAAASTLAVGATYEFDPPVTATGFSKTPGIGAVHNLQFSRGEFHGLNDGQFRSIQPGSLLFIGESIGWEGERFLFSIDSQPGSFIKPT